jgi:hypothetical protein
MWNFFPVARVHATADLQSPAGLKQVSPVFFELRNLGSLVCRAIPGRYSSSSLPPLFVTGRFATLSYTAGVSHVR